MFTPLTPTEVVAAIGTATRAAARPDDLDARHHDDVDLDAADRMMWSRFSFAGLRQDMVRLTAW